MSNKFKIGTRVQGVSFMEDGTYDQLGEGNIFKRHPFISLTILSLILCTLLVYTFPFFNEFGSQVIVIY